MDTPLDHFTECNFSDCPNPTLIKRFFQKNDSLSEEQREIVMYYQDECRKCGKYFKEEYQLWKEKQ